MSKRRQTNRKAPLPEIPKRGASVGERCDDEPLPEGARRRDKELPDDQRRRRCDPEDASFDRTEPQIDTQPFPGLAADAMTSTLSGTSDGEMTSTVGGESALNVPSPADKIKDVQVNSKPIAAATDEIGKVAALTDTPQPDAATSPKAANTPLLRTDRQLPPLSEAASASGYQPPTSLFERFVPTGAGVFVLVALHVAVVALLYLWLA